MPPDTLTEADPVEVPKQFTGIEETTAFKACGAVRLKLSVSEHPTASVIVTEKAPDPALLMLLPTVPLLQL